MEPQEMHSNRELTSEKMNERGPRGSYFIEGNKIYPRAYLETSFLIIVLDETIYASH